MDDAKYHADRARAAMKLAPTIVEDLGPEVAEETGQMLDAMAYEHARAAASAARRRGR